ncbi:MAG: hypothetical protein KGL10_01005 [Alphaproteobacteria bacterium]|nr:hypothetical protein [Alphaproteobacteria bacterium]MDE2335869.1 hypothetical protein [Alphaproteobacteria bacterium]
MALVGSKKRVLMVGGEGVTLFGPTVRGIEREAALSWEMPDFGRQLAEALSAGSRDPVLVLFDGADQTYRKEERIPKLSPFDRARYIKRKLDQAFPSYPVRASVLVRPPKESPFYLFVALPETDRLDGIAGDMLEAGVPIAGFGLLPAESVGLVKALADKTFDRTGKPSRWAVLISQHETGGLRQVVVRNGSLALTRITPTSEAGAFGPGWAEEVVREFKATLTYIARFGYTAEEGLDVMVVCSKVEKQFFSDKSLPVTNFRCLTPSEALAAIGARAVSLGETNFGDAVHAAWAGRKGALSVPVVVPSIQRIMVPRKASQVMAAVLALSLAGMGAFIASQYSDYLSVKSDIGGLRSQRDYLNGEYARDAKVFDAFPVKPDVLRKILAVRKTVEASSIDIAPTLNLLRASLASDIQLSDLSFTHDASSVLEGGDNGLFGKKKSEDRGTVKIDFKFDITGGLTLEQKVARADGLVKILQQKFPGYRVDIVHQFGNVSSTGSFSGEAGKAQNAQGPGGAGADEAAFEMTGPPL